MTRLITEKKGIICMTEDEKKAIENPLEGGWSVPRGYYSKLKYYGINIQKGFISFAAFMTSLQLQERVFPHEQIFQFILFVILFNILVIYLLLPTRTGGNNANAIWYFLTHRKKTYYCIDCNIYPKFNGGLQTKKHGRFRR